MCQGKKRPVGSAGATAAGLILLFSLCYSSLFAAAPSSDAVTGAAENIRVVTSIEPLSFFVKRVGGDRVHVAVMVPPGANPHSYEPRPAQMAETAKAHLFVKAGSGIEFELAWMNKLIALRSTMTVCNASQDVGLREMSERNHGHTHEHSRSDPHFWLSPDNAILIARNVERSLVALDPVHADEYAENLRKLEAQLISLKREITRKLSGIKNRSFMVFHPAWGYYAAAFNLKQIAAEEEGKELTPKKMQSVIRQARAEGVRVVFVSPTFSTLQAETIAREIGGVTRPVDPLSGEYIANLRQATGAFVESMR
ncbi:MAG: zinc ABC transporter substrate-binding protein [Chlorobium phaeobacteroides]|nr:zinc ABC transporter substrate-binding protein [Chlorobium phaeobacteroides]